MSGGQPGFKQGGHPGSLPEPAQQTRGLMLAAAPGGVQEARFDRHFVRDLTWSRHQLEQLAERRFIAAQKPSPGLTPDAVAVAPGKGPTAFASLFEKVGVRRRVSRL